jgi:hypothetical protein
MRKLSVVRLINPACVNPEVLLTIIPGLLSAETDLPEATVGLAIPSR